MENLFEIASKKKFRFPYTKGNITTEDLWDLSKLELNKIYLKLQEQKDKENVKSLLDINNTTSSLDQKIEIVKHVFTEKVTAAKKAEDSLARSQKKKELQAILKDKEHEAYRNMSVEQLKAEISNIDD